MYGPNETYEIKTEKIGDTWYDVWYNIYGDIINSVEAYSLNNGNSVAVSTDYDLSNVIRTGTSGNDTITNYGGMNVTIQAGAGDDNVTNNGISTYALRGNSLVAYLGGGNDTLTAYFTKDAVIFGGEGNDNIVLNGSKNNYVFSESGNDDLTFWSDSPYNYISLGDGDDVINSNGYGNTIYGGAGDDWISVGSTSVIFYEEGDGKDYITGFDENSTLMIAADSFTTTFGEGSGQYDVIVQVGDGSIQLGATRSKYQNLHIVKVSELPEVTLPAYISSSTTSSSTTSTTSTSDTSTNSNNSSNSTSTTSTTTSTATTSHTYSGGNKSITNYSAGQKINYSTDFTGIGFSGNNFMVNSSSGSLTIQNARNKIIDVAVGGNTVAYAYLANSGGEINGGGFSQLEIIIGGNNSANTITAGSGGSSLWGGSGGNDILTGGTGQDNFFFGKSDGADIINNAGSSDVVNLYDVSLADITAATASGNKISVTFNTGSKLQINSTENLSSTFNLADGSFKFNHDSGQWQNA